MTKVVINTVGTGLGELSPFINQLDVPRHDPKLVALVAIVQATTNCSLLITEIPDDHKYRIDTNGDGAECVVHDGYDWVDPAYDWGDAPLPPIHAENYDWDAVPIFGPTITEMYGTTSREQAQRIAKVSFDRIIANMEAVAEINPETDIPWSEGPIDTPRSVVTEATIAGYRIMCKALQEIVAAPTAGARPAFQIAVEALRAIK